MAGPSRHERTETTATPGAPNSLWRWHRARNPLRVAVNVAVIVLARFLPSMRAKNWLFRRLGMRVGPGVAWGFESTPDLLWPDRITVEAGTIVGYDVTILCHEFLRDGYRLGDVVIREGAMIGAGAIVLPGVEVGAEAQVAANSLVVEDVPPGETVVGVPAEPVDRDDS